MTSNVVYLPNWKIEDKFLKSKYFLDTEKWRVLKYYLKLHILRVLVLKNNCNIGEMRGIYRKYCRHLLTSESRKILYLKIKERKETQIFLMSLKTFSYDYYFYYLYNYWEIWNKNLLVITKLVSCEKSKSKNLWSPRKIS